MKKILYLTALCMLAPTAFSQSFSDDFENYNSTDKIAASSADWGAWSGINGGGADDVQISTAKAKSGTQALHFLSTAENGGPADILLHFGAEHSTGIFEMSWSIFVETGKSAYFNFQEKTKPGEVWTLDGYMNDDGTLDISSGLIGTRISTTYNQNEWIDLKFVADLNRNEYEFFINTVSQGKFQNGARQIASLNFYPTQGNDFHIDDISFSHTPYSKLTSNASLTYIDGVDGFLSGSKVIPSFEIRNLGTSEITEAKVKIEYGGYSKSQSFTGLSIKDGELFNTAWDEELIIVEGANPFTVTIESINGSADEYADDNSKSILLDPIVPPEGRVVIGEEATGTWCGWCPRGAVALDNMDKKYHGFFQGIAVHNGDPMVNGNYDKGFGTLISGYPSGSVDRGADIDPGNFEGDFLKRIIELPTGIIKSAAEFDKDTRELKVSLSTIFNEDISGDWRIACVIIEDSVTGTESAYRQSNTYSGGANGEMGGFELLPNPVPAEDMVYMHVARTISPNFGGLPNSFGDMTQGQSKTHEFTFDINRYWDHEKIHVIGLLINPSGRIDNGSTTTISDALEAQYVQGEAVVGVQDLDPKNLSIGPNPVKDELYIHTRNHIAYEAQIVNIQGKILWNGVLEDGMILDVSDYTSGVYFIKTATFNKRIIVE